jgi:hypothetical protein
MTCHTQAPKQQRSWSQSVLCAQVYKRIAASGPVCCDFTLLVARFLHVHTDLVGPLPTSVSYAYCLTAVDCFTCWPEVVSIPDITADTVALALRTGWISCFRCPQTIATNQGHQFESQFSQSLARLCSIPLSQLTAHHSAAKTLGTLPLDTEGNHHVPRGPTVVEVLPSAAHKPWTCELQTVLNNTAPFL